MKVISMFRGRGIKRILKRFFVNTLKFIDVFQLIHNTPSKLSTLQSQLYKGSKIIVHHIFDKLERTEKEPVIWNYKITKRFSQYFNRLSPEGFVANIKGGRVAGESSNWIIFSDGTLSVELSREFGAYGGMELTHSRLINEKIKFSKINKFKGKIAVITTCGFNNFHHWNYDCLPRLFLLKQVIDFDEIDFFVIHHNHYSFQIESLKLFGINMERIIQISSNQVIEADSLYVPSLPSDLGTVSPWVIEFLRDFYGSSINLDTNFKRIYISRKNVSTRKVVNNEIFQGLLSKFGFIEIFPEDFTVSEIANLIQQAEIIISVHGSGLSNICFMSPGTKVIDILAPFHQDGYYWQISNICDGMYFGFFAEGEHPHDSLDLVKQKIDDDIFINIRSLEELLHHLI
jgi:hypothetical protein